MRGTLGAGRYPCPNDRIIPAYAGNAAQQQPFLSLMTDHPRVCGERPNVTNHIALSNGSSPRMRGTLVAKQVCANHSRIIPAYAGNAFLMSYVIAPFPDHPRVCGERQTTMRYAPTVIGSSPRMRGTRQGVVGKITHGRIIPAYAGNASLPASICSIAADHPRVCGERSECLLLNRSATGSSPRMRGTRSPPRPWWAAFRIIPAYAGNAREARTAAVYVPDHPRVCGERLADRAALRGPAGSSPRMRGTRSACRRCHGRTPDHPRVCGERSGSPIAAGPCRGSSPRMRGTRSLS